LTNKPHRPTLGTEARIMSTQVNIAQAKAKLSALLDRAVAGEEIVIARAGNPIARLVPLKKRRKPGAWKHLNIDTDVFLEPMDPEDLDWAEGKYNDEYGITLPDAPKR
jgi:prevent-host-death family protein